MITLYSVLQGTVLENDSALSSKAMICNIIIKLNAMVLDLDKRNLKTDTD
jgi:hypothetical protein